MIPLPARTPAPRVTNHDLVRTTMATNDAVVLSLMPAPPATNHDQTRTAMTTNDVSLTRIPTSTTASMVSAVTTLMSTRVRSTWGLLVREAAGTWEGEGEAKARRTWLVATVACVSRQS